MNNGTPGKNITNEELNELPLGAYDGEVVVISDPEKVPHAFNEINAFERVGFDTETKPVFVRGHHNKVAILQLATPKKAYLFRLNATGLTHDMKVFFENPKILKIGVAIRDDIKALQLLKKFTPEGFVELTTLTKAAGFEAEGVKKLTAMVLGFRISKSAQTSNWEAPKLDEKQITYAATDAWVCLRIYEAIKVPLMWDETP
jgi:ribonuclease D